MLILKASGLGSRVYYRMGCAVLRLHSCEHCTCPWIKVISISAVNARLFSCRFLLNPVRNITVFLTDNLNVFFKFLSFIAIHVYNFEFWLDLAAS